MMGSFLTRGLTLVFGFAYPAYECYKTVEMNNPGIEQLRFWCQYWILVAWLTVLERVADTFVSWLPMYSEVKLAFFVYLWYSKTKGATYVYDSWVRPYLSKHETDIDRGLLELRTRATDIVVLYWQKAASYGQARFFEILQFVASQSQSSRIRPVQQPQQQQQQQQRIHQAPPPMAPASSAATDSTVLATKLDSETTQIPVPTNAEEMEIDHEPAIPAPNQDMNDSLQGVAVEVGRVTRARMRRRANPPANPTGG